MSGRRCGNERVDHVLVDQGDSERVAGLLEQLPGVTVAEPSSVAELRPEVEVVDVLVGEDVELPSRRSEREPADGAARLAERVPQLVLRLSPPDSLARDPGPHDYPHPNPLPEERETLAHPLRRPTDAVAALPARAPGSAQRCGCERCPEHPVAAGLGDDLGAVERVWRRATRSGESGWRPGRADPPAAGAGASATNRSTIADDWILPTWNGGFVAIRSKRRLGEGRVAVARERLGVPDAVSAGVPPGKLDRAEVGVGEDDLDPPSPAGR